MKINKLRDKIIIYFCFIFLLLNICPISIITCNKEQNVCKCIQIFRVFEKRKHTLKQIKLSDVQQVVYYKENCRTNYGIVNNIYPGYGIGIELKQRQKFAFYGGEKGDYIIPFYDAVSKAKTEEFVSDFNKFIEEDRNIFYNIHVNSLLIILSVALGFIIFI